MKKIVSIVGARPQFIKMAPVSVELRRYFHEIAVHTGQHYDYEMSEAFFREMDLPRPDYDLEVGSGTHGAQTGEMLIRIEEVLLAEGPSLVVVYGDTNSTLAGALAAAKLHIPVAHIEAGMRSYTSMPEEINRVICDHISQFLFCPTRTAVRNLAREGIRRGVFLVGDVMLDAFRKNLPAAKGRSPKQEGIRPGEYFLLTLHRAENTDDPERLDRILSAVLRIPGKVLFPVHPRTRKVLEKHGIEKRIRDSNIIMLEPLSFMEMIDTERSARMILTDSGGVQKEAYFLGVPCLTLREETEWPETVASGWNTLVGADPERILKALKAPRPKGRRSAFFGRGQVSKKIAEILAAEIG